MMAKLHPFVLVCSLLYFMVLFLSKKTCFADARQTSQCPIVNNVTKAMMCCGDGTQNLSPGRGKKCRTVYPMESISLMPGTWSQEAFEEAHQSTNNKSLDPRPNKFKACCCKEIVRLILPRVAFNTKGKPVKIVQNSFGYVQPIEARTCKKLYCSGGRQRKPSNFACIQDWAAMEMYVEDASLVATIYSDNIQVPTGCNCKLLTDSSKSRSGIEAWLPGESTELDYSFSNTSDFDDDTQENLSFALFDDVRYVNISKELEIGPILKDIDEYDNHSSFYNSTNEDSFNDIDLAYLDEFYFMTNKHKLQIFGQYDAHNPQPFSLDNSVEDYQIKNSLPADFLSNLDKVSEVPLKESKLPPPELQNYINAGLNIDTDTATKIQELISNSLLKNQSTFVLASKLEKLRDLDLQQLVPQKLESSLGNLDTLTTNFLNKYLFEHLGKNTPGKIWENILHRISSNEYMPVLLIMVMSMLLENEKSKQSLAMMKVLLEQNESLATLNNNPKFSDIPEDQDIASILKPHIFLENTEASSVPSSLADTNSTILHQNEKLDAGVLEDQTTPAGVSHPSIINSVGSRITLEDMIEDQFHTAFANFLFSEAWMNISCMVPVTIDENLSELDFLPFILKEHLGNNVQGSLDINKFAARIITGIVLCHFDDSEAALLDGRLARAISAGVKVTQLLTKHIKIMKEVMKGLLNIGDAEAIVSILKWSIQPIRNPISTSNLPGNDVKDINDLVDNVTASFSTFVESLKTKSFHEKFLNSSLSSQILIDPIPSVTSKNITIAPEKVTKTTTDLIEPVHITEAAVTSGSSISNEDTDNWKVSTDNSGTVSWIPEENVAYLGTPISNHSLSNSSSPSSYASGTAYGTHGLDDVNPVNSSTPIYEVNEIDSIVHEVTGSNFGNTTPSAISYVSNVSGDDYGHYDDYAYNDYGYNDDSNGWNKPEDEKAKEEIGLEVVSNNDQDGDYKYSDYVDINNSNVSKESESLNEDNLHEYDDKHRDEYVDEYVYKIDTGSENDFKSELYFENSSESITNILESHTSAVSVNQGVHNYDEVNSTSSYGDDLYGKVTVVYEDVAHKVSSNKSSEPLLGYETLDYSENLVNEIVTDKYTSYTIIDDSSESTLNVYNNRTTSSEYEALLDNSSESPLDLYYNGTISPVSVEYPTLGLHLGNTTDQVVQNDSLDDEYQPINMSPLEFRDKFQLFFPDLDM